ncbi:MAG: DUF1553 domain-containing protein [Saprospiraceae bacterium]|nr:DUF1553 domain-containing protein [Saprospiraceae bacterium]
MMIRPEDIVWALISMWLFIISCQGDGGEAAFTPSIPDQVDYNFHVKPILSDRCFNCHGPDAKKREANLRLDVAESAYAELTDHPGTYAIVPGSLNKSVLYERIISDDPDVMMPPPDSKLTISEREKAILARWILQDAPYEVHWSFQSPTAPEVPKDMNPVDYFVNQSLDENHLTANARADRQQLIRRAYFDLNGLPPSLDEVDRFLSDTVTMTVDKIIDTLLSRKAYGERMAADWMDVARYADSDGYLDDKHREFSPWRDWVIDAFNQNMPYDQFATWQLAGDLIPDASQESILATAFNRLHRKNSEAGIVFEEYRSEYVADRVHTFSKAFLGLTMECARCHDHKYDPISQKEYYQLFAYFNSTNEIGTAVYGPGQTPGPSLFLTSDDQQKKIDFIEKKIKEQEVKIREAKERSSVASVKSYSKNDLSRSTEKKLVSYTTFEKISDNKVVDEKSRSEKGKVIQPHLGPGFSGKGFYVDDYNYVLLGDKIGWYDRTDPFAVSLWLRPNHHYREAGIFTHCEDLRLGYKGYSLHLENNHLRFIMAFSWPTNAIEVTTIDSLPVEEWSQVCVSYDGSSHASGVRLYINGKPAKTKIVIDNLSKSILFEPNIHTYGFAGFRLGYRDKIKLFKGGGFDEIKIFGDQLSDLEVRYNYDPLNFETVQNSQEILRHFQLNDDVHIVSLTDSLQSLRNELNLLTKDIPEIMVMGDLPEPRPTYLLERGRYDAPGEQVYPSLPKILHTDGAQFSANRLGLAQWLFSDDNPLTARVFVNRIWQQHFGRGLVKTAEDFGAQGDLPSHPELLDWLSVWFQSSGWDIKKLHRLIMTSQAYQRSSVIDSSKLALDPENIYLWRGPSLRLSAEMLRDNALAISGLLVTKVGGKSVYPYQPAGLWDELSNKVWRYPYLQEPGEGLYRRSLYTIWKRTSPPPSMLLFDAPDRSFCTVQRRETSTPLQALVLLNDPQYVEVARMLALHCRKQHTDLDQCLQEIFRLTVGRYPNGEELNLVQDFFKNELAEIEKGTIDVAAYLSSGEMEVPPGVDNRELAALAITGHNLLNTYEAQLRK